MVESGGRVDARSGKNALGLFQVSMVTAQWRAELLGLPPPTEEELLSDPLLNARLGADNLAWLLDTYEGDVERALVAYNAGTRRLKSYCDEAGSWEAWRSQRLAAGDSALLAYAARVMDMSDRLRADGLFAEAEPSPAPEASPEAGTGSDRP
jgi:soluble lytic murein transglycosylase-like protein